MSTRLVSIMGTGGSGDGYDVVPYRLDGYASRPTALMPAAIVDLYRQRGEDERITSVALIGTAEAKDYYDTSLLTEQQSLLKSIDGPVAFDLVGAGAREEDQRQLFTTLVGWLQPIAIERSDLQFREPVLPDRIVLDITHGFRAQGLIAGAAVTFVLADSLRRKAVEKGTIRILYGQHEKYAGTGIPDYKASIWDLTDYTSATLWTLAVQAARYGRADAARILATQETAFQRVSLKGMGMQGSELAPANYPATLGRALSAFADDLVFMRAKRIVSKSGPNLVSALEARERTDLETRIPALRDLLDDLERDARLVTSSTRNLLDQEGLRATAELADLYERMERFAERAGALREAFVTLYGLRHWNEEPIEPGTKGTNESRERLERAIKTVEAPDDDRRLEVVSMSRDAFQVRNDVLHLGISDNPSEPARIRKNLDRLASALRESIMNEP